MKPYRFLSKAAAAALSLSIVGSSLSVAAIQSDENYFTPFTQETDTLTVTEAEPQAGVDLQESDPGLAQVIGKNEVPLSFLLPDVQGNPWWYAARIHETNLGDFVADAYRTRLGAQIGLVNGGAIRWKEAVMAIEPQQLTYQNMVDINPYGNMLSLAQVSGSQLLDALEYSVRTLTPKLDSATEASGSFLQVSGIQFVADLTIPSPVTVNSQGDFVSINGKRRISNVMIGRTAVQNDSTYTLAAPAPLFAGESGFTMLKGATILENEVMLDYDCLASYLQENLGGVINNGYQSGVGAGRIDLIVGSSTPYTDIDPNAWYAPAVQMLYDQKIMTGLTKTEFGVDAITNRAQFVTTLFRMMDPQQAASVSASTTKNETPFGDCKNYSYYTPAVNWAYKNKLVSGTSERRFSPNAPITCEQIVTILYRAFGKNNPGNASVLNDFKDKQIVSDYARNGMIWAVNNDIIHGSNGYLYPINQITRARTAMILYNGLINHIFD